MNQRPFGVILMGATGFTGGLVAEEFARRLSPGDRPWAIAGRSTDKLEAVRAALTRLRPSCGEMAMFEADLADVDRLREIARSTDVIVSTAGPFDRLGHQLVEACVAEGTHYLDITGEPGFVEAIRRRHQDEAQRRGVRIVPCCGFDSVPADLGALFTVLNLPAEGSTEVLAYLRVKGKPSGGTWNSVLEGLANAPKPARPKEGGASKENRPARKLHRAPGGGYGLPLPIIDPILVRRSARALPHVYSPFFNYGHYLRLSSRWAALKLMVSLGLLVALARIKPVRAWLAARRPSGVGPTPEERAASWFHLDFYGRSDHSEVHTRVSGGDPGYTETSRMLASLALLLLDETVLLPEASGILTPAQAFGEAGIAAVQDVGIRFQVVTEEDE